MIQTNTKNLELTIEYRKIRNFAISAFVLILCGLGAFVGAIFGTGLPIEHLFWSTNDNPFINLVNNPTTFFTVESNIIFFALMMACFVLVFVGGIVLPTMNIYFAGSLENRSLFISTIFASPLCLATLVLWPIAFWVSLIVVMFQANSLSKQSLFKDEIKENVNENANVIEKSETIITTETESMPVVNHPTPAMNPHAALNPALRQAQPLPNGNSHMMPRPMPVQQNMYMQNRPVQMMNRPMQPINRPMMSTVNGQRVMPVNRPMGVVGAQPMPRPVNSSNIINKTVTTTTTITEPKQNQ